MTVRDIRTAARLIGRRNALRYLAIGAGAALLAACTGKDRPKAASGSSAAPSTGPSTTSAASSSPSTAASGSATPGPAATPARRGVLERSFEAFLKGPWAIESTSSNGLVARAAATVELSSWTIVWEGDGGTWRGGHRLHGSGVLAIEVHEGPKALTRETGTQAHQVPEKVADGFELTLPWQPPGRRRPADDQRLSVTYAGNTLTIRHVERSGSTTTHVCTRA
ncbi:hypothetical protein [Streptomyces sp. NPDC012888]|uniref:hypothetical protein n=1 Tax=Streptomyces sp. NPDC012888 TaxID=3364855 RepID=UPI00369A1AAC